MAFLRIEIDSNMEERVRTNVDRNEGREFFKKCW